MREVEKVYTDDYDENADMLGFLGSETVALRLRRQLKEAKEMGARILIGGEVREHRVNGSLKYYPQATVLTDVNHEMELMREETFAPVIPIMSFSTEEEALQLANDSKYGLTATVLGGSLQFLRKIRRTHGLVFENDTLTSSMRRITLSGQWGGFKQSAWIWEWDGVHFSRREGPRLLLREFTQPTRKFCPQCRRLYRHGYAI
jgi:acyl-CoA reductase-like NAD-dependent aldehyde dehydrogenase